MIEKSAYWMRFYDGKNHNNIAVIADSLDDAFDIIIKKHNVTNDKIFYRNRELTVLVPEKKNL
jgi:hypothetical protein